MPGWYYHFLFVWLVCLYLDLTQAIYIFPLNWQAPGSFHFPKIHSFFFCPNVFSNFVMKFLKIPNGCKTFSLVAMTHPRLRPSWPANKPQRKARHLPLRSSERLRFPGLAFALSFLFPRQKQMFLNNCWCQTLPWGWWNTVSLRVCKARTGEVWFNRKRGNLPYKILPGGECLQLYLTRGQGATLSLNRKAATCSHWGPPRRHYPQTSNISHFIPNAELCGIGFKFLTAEWRLPA